MTLLIALVMLLAACGAETPVSAPEPTSEITPEISETPEPEPDPEAEESALSPADTQQEQSGNRPMGGGDRGGNGGGMSMNVENDAEALAILAECAPKFEQYTFTDSDTGFELEYSLFVPEGWDSSTSYPLIQFMPDSTGTGKSASELVENYLGASIWACERDQSKHPCFVLVPAYTNTLADDDWSVSSQLETGIKLLRWIIAEYNVDASKVSSSESDAYTLL